MKNPLDIGDSNGKKFDVSSYIYFMCTKMNDVTLLLGIVRVAFQNTSLHSVLKKYMLSVLINSASIVINSLGWFYIIHHINSRNCKQHNVYIAYIRLWAYCRNRMSVEIKEHLLHYITTYVPAAVYNLFKTVYVPQVLCTPTTRTKTIIDLELGI